MASNTPISVDPRIMNPLVCNPDDSLARFPAEILTDVACSLDLFSNLIGSATANSPLLYSESQRSALSLQLSGMASILEAVADSLEQEKNSNPHPNKLLIDFSPEELDVLRKVAAMRRCAVENLAHVLIEGYANTLRAAFGPDRQTP